MKIEKIVPDTSVIIEGILSKKVLTKDLVVDEIIIHEAAVSELEHQANENRAIGLIGLNELEKLQELQSKIGFILRFGGLKPTITQKKFATLGEIDSIIRDLAFDEDATLITSDKIQARVAKAKGIKCVYEKVIDKKKKLLLEKYFDLETMSVHLRENVKPYAKKGKPGSWEFIAVKDTKLTRDDIQKISQEIIEEAKIRKDGFIEIERPGSTIIQLGNFRIVITKPPFSDGWEITAVRPVKKLILEDYNLSENLMQRISGAAEGILIAGAPGMGKSTFAAALAEHYADQNKIVKTVEAPRDLVLPEKITQYAISHGDAQEIHDILLLSRPDYTFFDEMRNTGDFKLFADLRLSGIGFIGIVHATNPIDAIQRFVGRIELGVIPQVIDTVIFIKNGTVEKVLSVQMLVKVPSGMTEADLARPIVVVTDFETKTAEFELYSYGEETVVIPVTQTHKSSPTHELAARQLESELSKFSRDVEVEILSDNKCAVYVPEDIMAKIIGKQGKNINEIEKKYGLSIDVKPLEKSSKQSKDQVKFNVKVLNKTILFTVNMKYINQDLNVVIDDDYLLTTKVSKKGIIKIKKGNKIGRILANSINAGENIILTL
jgi:ATPase